MEATRNQKNNERANKVNNLVKFSNGDYRRPEVAILLPDMHSVLCRAGSHLGLAAFISRREANKKCIEYCHPDIWCGKLAVYTNCEVRDLKGRFVGTYIGTCSDELITNPFSSSRYIYLERDEKFFEYASDGGVKEVTWEQVVKARTGVNHPEFFEKAQELLNMPETVLRAALALKERQSEAPRKKGIIREELPLSSKELVAYAAKFIREDEEEA